MTKTVHIAALSLPLPFILLLPVSAGVAQTSSSAIAGAMPSDKSMTCEMIADERAAIYRAVADKAAKKERSAKLKKGLFGFAKGVATVMVPGAALLGGNSMMGSLAAQSAGQSAAQVLGRGGTDAAKPAEALQPIGDQAARLARLEAIGADRPCAAA